MSVFAVFVAALGTFAWFQVSSKTANSSDKYISSASSDLDITGVTGHKMVYDDIDFGVTDYTSGEVTSHNLGGVDSYTDNADRESRNNSNYPLKGEGFYILGNDKWVEDYSWFLNGTKSYITADPWKYGSAAKMKDWTFLSGGSNKAVFEETNHAGSVGIELTEGTIIRAVKYSYSYDTNNQETSSETWFTGFDASSSGYLETDPADSNNVRVKTSGRYKIYLTSAGKIAVSQEASSISARSRLPNRGTKNTITASSGQKVIYFDIGVWNTSSPVIGAYMWGGSPSGWSVMTATDVSGIYEVNAGTNTGVKFGRFETGTTQGQMGWNKVDANPAGHGWNYTDEDDTISDNRCFVNKGWDTGTDEVDTCVTAAYGVSGGSWTRKLISKTTETCSTNITLTATQEFKVITGTGEGSWKGYSYLNNASKTICGNNSDNITVPGAGTYTIGWNNETSKVTCSLTTAIIRYGTIGSSWSSAAIGSSISLNKDQAFKVVYEQTYYGYSALINGKVFFVNDDDNIKALLKGSYTVSFDTSTSKISLSFTTSSFGSLSTNDSSTTYYLDCNNVSNWKSSASGYAVIAYDASGNAGWYPMSQVFGDVYSAKITNKAHTGVYFVRYTSSITAESTNIANAIAGRTNAVSASNPNYMYIISSGSDPGPYSGSWAIYYGNPPTGYYIVGDSSFVSDNGNSGNAWSFDSAVAMTGTCPTQIKAAAYNVKLVATRTFKVWHFTSGTGRDEIHNTLNGDANTALIVSVSGNITVKSNVNGYFNIYLTNSDKIIIESRDISASVYYSTSTGPTTNHKDMQITESSGSGSLTASYDEGLIITSPTYIAILTKSRLGGVPSIKDNSDLKSTSGIYTDYLDGTGSLTISGYSATAFKLKRAGIYNFYLDSNNKIAFSYQPSKANTKASNDLGGDGFYIVPYNSSLGTGVYTGGFRMKTVNNPSNGSAKNFAIYNRFSVAAGDKFFIKGFWNNINWNPIGTLATASDKDFTRRYVTIDGSGVITFNTYIKDGSGNDTDESTTGSYNFYVYKENSTYKVSIAKYNADDFCRLNSVPSTCDGTLADVRGANTSLILDIAFAAPANNKYDLSLQALIPSNVSGGASKYLRYACVIDPTLGGTSAWDYMRNTTNVYTEAKMKKISSNTSISPTYGTYDSSTTSHHLFVIIDYDWTADVIKSIPNGGLTRDFSLLVKLTQK